MGCQQTAAPPPAPTPTPTPAPIADAAAPNGAIAIEKVPGIPGDAYRHAAKDCRLSTVARRHFAGAIVVPCNAGDDAAAEACMTKAIAAKQPFIAEREVHGIDSAVVRGIVGVVEAGKLEIYGLMYDSNPCGGGCPERGHTAVYKCTKFAFEQKGCEGNPFLCFACNEEDAKPVEDCEYGLAPLGCVADSWQWYSCDAKGAQFSYGPERSRLCGGAPPSPGAAEAERHRLEKAKCACLDVAAERQWAESCSHRP